MQIKAEWLFNHKTKAIAQLNDLEAQSKEFMNALLAENTAQGKEIDALKDARKEAENAYREEIAKYVLQIRTLEQLIISKDNALEQLKSQNAQLTTSSQEQATASQQQYTRLIQLEHLLSVERGEKERMGKEMARELQSKTDEHLQQLSRVKKEYEEQISQREARLLKSHQQELAEIKHNNMQLLRKIEDDYQATASKSTQSSKKTELDCNRLVTQNTKLLATVNDNKMRILTLESSLNSQVQQARILQKELEVLKENSRRENTFLKEEKTALADRNRKMAERIEELTWNTREAELRKEEELKKIKRQVDKSFQEVLDKAQQDTKQAEEANDRLKQELQEKTRQYEQMQQISLKVKDIIEQREKEIQQMRKEKEELEKQVSAALQSAPAKANQQLKNQLIRKNCEAQVLQDEIKRLKAKVNTAVNAQQQYIRNKELLLQENKMLLAQILFLKKEKAKGKESRLSRSNFLSEMNSEQSRDQGEIQQYKKLIEMMTVEMTEVSKKIVEKDNKIEKLEALVKRYERELRDLK